MGSDMEESLIDVALGELREFLRGMTQGEEAPRELDVAGGTEDFLSLGMPGNGEGDEEDDEAEEVGEDWVMGVAGHGVQSLRFYCHWKSRRLDVTLVLPYGRVLESEEMEQQQRQQLMACCFLVYNLLNAEKEGIVYAENEPDAGLRMTCDVQGIQYQIHEGSRMIVEGDDWRDLEKMLDAYQKEEDKAKQEGAMILMP